MYYFRILRLIIYNIAWAFVAAMAINWLLGKINVHPTSLVLTGITVAMFLLYSWTSRDDLKPLTQGNNDLFPGM
jgi:hypothetical protein